MSDEQKREVVEALVRFVVGVASGTRDSSSQGGLDVTEAEIVALPLVVDQLRKLSLV